MTSKRYGVLSWVVVAGLVMGCDEPEDNQDYEAACAGGKCDEAEPPQCLTGKCDDAFGDTDGDAEEFSCPDDEEMVKQARGYLVQRSPEFGEVEWKPGRVEALEDLDDDGVPERLVFPGSGERSTDLDLLITEHNEDRILYMSKGSACAEHFAGAFFGFDLEISVTQQRINGALEVAEHVLDDTCNLRAYFSHYNGDQYELYTSQYLGFACEEP